MKKLSSILMIALSACALQACHSGSSSSSTADSTTVTKDSTTTLTAKKDSSLVSESDAKFAMDAANGGMTEIALSKLAETKATSKKIKDFAAMMVMDHSKAGAELKGIADLKHIMLPDSVNSDSKMAIADMSKKSGSDFDKAYVNKMVADHKATVDMFQAASGTLKDADLKGFVDKTLPTIKGHLAKITAIKDGMK